jgi:hypothetical protein
MVAVLDKTDKTRDAAVVAKALNNLVILADRPDAAQGLVDNGVVARVAGYIDAEAEAGNGNGNDAEAEAATDTEAQADIVPRCASILVGLLEHQATGLETFTALRDGGHLDRWVAAGHSDVRLACARVLGRALQSEGAAMEAAAEYIVQVVRRHPAAGGADTAVQALLAAGAGDAVSAFMAKGGLDPLLALGVTDDDYAMVAAAVARLAQGDAASVAAVRAGLLTALQQGLLGDVGRGLRTAAVMMLAGPVTAGWAVDEAALGRVLAGLGDAQALDGQDADVQQGVAEVLAAAATHKACQGLVAQHADTLDRLGASPHPRVAVRALVASAKRATAAPHPHAHTHTPDREAELVAIYTAVRPFFVGADQVRPSPCVKGSAWSRLAF